MFDCATSVHVLPRYALSECRFSYLWVGMEPENERMVPIEQKTAFTCTVTQEKALESTCGEALFTE